MRYYRFPRIARNGKNAEALLEDCKAKFKIAWVRIRAGLTDWDIAKAQKCGEGNRPENAIHRRHDSPPKPRVSAKGRPD